MIIGNGFDLAHGLKTRYVDFLVWYLNQLFKKHYESGTLNGYEDELVIIKGVPIEDRQIESINDYRTFLENIFAPSIEYKNDFLSVLINNCESYNWVDIERVYFEQLLGLYKYCEKDDGVNLS